MVIIRYDEEFMRNFEELQARIDAGDPAALHRFLIDRFGIIFRVCQEQARQAAEGAVPEFDQADEETKRELMRPLSWRQYRKLEISFSRWEEETEDVIASVREFLYDYGRIYQKKVMSSAEVSACSMILENVYCCLDRLERKAAQKSRTEEERKAEGPDEP
jgi:hypothetical protein